MFKDCKDLVTLISLLDDKTWIKIYFFKVVNRLNQQRQTKWNTETERVKYLKSFKGRSYNENKLNVNKSIQKKLKWIGMVENMC